MAKTQTANALPVITNSQARHLLLARQGLSDNPGRRLDKGGLLQLIEKLGFVQVDSINTVERAHHHILFCRNQTYRQKQLAHLIERDASLFENWTHDAAVIPCRFYPFWHRRFQREEQRLAVRWRISRCEGFEDYLSAVQRRIEREGPLMARDFGENGKKASGGWWDWHLEKVALEFLWRTGVLAVARRENFQKVYDLADRVIPRPHLDQRPSKEDFVDWSCRSALDRLGFATHGELAAFWDMLGPAEAKTWCRAQRGRTIQEVLVEPADGGKPRAAYVPLGLIEALDSLPEPPARVRTLNPFDPLIRDRNRLERIFGFRYRIEVFVPAPKRQYGYYVFPLLEGERLVGRIDMKHERQAGNRLAVKGLWLEPKVRMSRGRRQRLESELNRIRRFVGAESVDPLPEC